MPRQVAGAVDEDENADPGGKQRVEGGEPVEGEVETEVERRGPGDLDRASSGQPARQTGNERHRRARHRRPGEHVGASKRHATRT